jgi:ribonuclease R
MSRKQSKNKNKKSSQSDTLKGVLDITRSGMGFVVVENNPEDILVRPTDFNTAMHGDIVRVKVRGDHSRSGRKQGEITEVVKRKQMEFMGRVELSKNFAFFIVNSDKPVPDIYVPLNKLNGADNGDQAIVRIVEWEKNKKPVGEVIQVMDASDVNDQAMKEILMENGFALMFPDSVIEESERISDVLPAAEIKKRRDFRDILTFTIDPVDAKDFDDAISFQVMKNGDYEIGVHIADVSFYVEPDTELDREAYDRATSVYLPDRVSPMLPERISNELCSLRPHEDKFTFSAVFEVTQEGEIKSQWFGRTVIHSDHRFTYEEAQEIIEQEDGPYKDQVLLLNGLAQKYRKRRFKKGAINFSSQEVRFKLDEKGKPIGIVVKESKEAHQLIEEFMLLANRAVAEAAGKIKIDKQELPFPYRVHDTPDEVKLTPFITFAKKYGHTFDTSSPEGISKSFNQMLDDVKGKPEQHVLEQLGIRTMAKAIYTTENIGHYGLGFEHYCHFTSPIRRYPDIIVHRILQDILDKKAQPDKKLEQKCKQCSDKERSAMEAERAANKYKQVEYMQDYLGEEFEGVISGVSNFGFWVETVQHKCEGLVSISSLQDYDDFRLIEGEYSLAGLRSGRKFRMGDKVTIKIVAANLTKRQLDYEWVLAQSASSGVNKAAMHPDTAVVKPVPEFAERRHKDERLSDTEKYAGKRADGKKRGAMKSHSKENVSKQTQQAPVPADTSNEVKAEVEVWIPENRSSVPDENKGSKPAQQVPEIRNPLPAKPGGSREGSSRQGPSREGGFKQGGSKADSRDAGSREGGFKEGGSKADSRDGGFKEGGSIYSGSGKSKPGHNGGKSSKGKSHKSKSGKQKTNKDAGKPKGAKHKTKGTTPKSKGPKS